MHSSELRSYAGKSSNHAGSTHWLSKVLALIVLLLCVAIGMVGLILPVIPGFLFLMIAALIAARLHPPLEHRMRKHRATRAYLDQASSFSNLDLAGKVRLLGWMMLRMFIDSIVMTIAAIAWILRWLAKPLR